MQLEEIVELTLRKSNRGGQASAAFLDQHSSRPRYAIGKNPETLAVHRIAPLDGIIDDYAKQGEIWHDIPLLHTRAANKNGAAVNCSTSIRPVDASNHLHAAGFNVVLELADLVYAAGGSLPWPDFVQTQRREMRQHTDAWQAIHDELADEASRKTLRDVLRFRLTGDPDYMRSYQVRLSEQYFEDFMDYRNEVFVDAGGYDGDTSEAFASRYPDYRKIQLFEPSATNMAAARVRLCTFRDIEFFPIGLSDAPGRLRFDPESGSASAVSDAGGDEIVVDTLDATVGEPVSFIKMDLEGWELPALRGAQGHIRDSQPKLAIAAYHNSADLRRLHQFVKSFGNRYQMFLRHYTQGWSETVLFFRR